MTKPSQFPETFTLDDTDVFLLLKGMPLSPAEHKIAVADLREELGGGGGGGGGGAIELIDEVIVGSGGASSISFTSIPGTFRHLRLVAQLRTTQSATPAAVEININGDTTSGNYHRDTKGSTSSSVSDFYHFLASGSPAPAGAFASNVVDFPHYTGPIWKSYAVLAAAPTATNAVNNRTVACVWKNTAAITDLALVALSGNFVEHSMVSLYGVK
jgi:hypothetical protein